MANSTKSKRRNKSKHQAAGKTCLDFPLTPHPAGRWCKKRKKRFYYFGPITDWRAAFEQRPKWGHHSRQKSGSGREMKVG